MGNLVNVVIRFKNGNTVTIEDLKKILVTSHDGTQEISDFSKFIYSNQFYNFIGKTRYVCTNREEIHFIIFENEAGEGTMIELMK